ncbi:MAG: hypothetical protein JWN70_471 [Planctomycetaceae bacterium]|nr:hypothetical protein [Planctomycetaceae bacterium]
MGLLHYIGYLRSAKARIHRDKLGGVSLEPLKAFIALCEGNTGRQPNMLVSRQPVEIEMQNTTRNQFPGGVLH